MVKKHKVLKTLLIILFLFFSLKTLCKAGHGFDYICSSCDFKTNVLHFGGGFEGGNYTYGYCYQCREFSMINQESKEIQINKLVKRIERLKNDIKKVDSNEKTKYEKLIQKNEQELKKVEQEKRGEIICPGCNSKIEYYSCRKCNSIIVPFDFNKEICPKCGKKTFRRGKQALLWD